MLICLSWYLYRFVFQCYPPKDLKNLLERKRELNFSGSCESFLFYLIPTSLTEVEESWDVIRARLDIIYVMYDSYNIAGHESSARPRRAAFCALGNRPGVNRRTAPTTTLYLEVNTRQ